MKVRRCQKKKKRSPNKTPLMPNAKVAFTRQKIQKKNKGKRKSIQQGDRRKKTRMMQAYKKK